MREFIPSANIQKFESNSQHLLPRNLVLVDLYRRQIYKNLKATHNNFSLLQIILIFIPSANIQKFESNSQRKCVPRLFSLHLYRRQIYKNLKATHNNSAAINFTFLIYTVGKYTKI